MTYSFDDVAVMSSTTKRLTIDYTTPNHMTHPIRGQR